MNIVDKINQKSQTFLYSLSNQVRDIALEKNLTPSNTSYQKFVILCGGRCGSNFLVSLLKSNPKFLCYNEVFHFHLPVWGYPYLEYKNSINNLKLREENIGKYVEKEIYRKYQQSIQAVGFKLQYWHTEQGESWRQDIIPYLLTIPELKIIHLKRKNGLRVYLSDQIARRDNRWLSEKKLSSKEVQPIELDYEGCLKSFESRHQLSQKYDLIFKSNDILEVFYEDLCNETLSVTQSLQKFLEVESKTLTGSTKKIIQSSLSAQITNYSELKAKFSDTQWSHYFED